MIPQPNRDGSWAKAQILQRVPRPARGFQASGKRSDHQGCACCHFAWAGSPAPAVRIIFAFMGPRRWSSTTTPRTAPTTSTRCGSIRRACLAVTPEGTLPRCTLIEWLRSAGTRLGRALINRREMSVVPPNPDLRHSGRTVAITAAGPGVAKATHHALSMPQAGLVMHSAPL